MRRSSIGCCTIAGVILIVLKLCGQLDSVSWFIILLPWTFDILLTAIAAFYFKRKLAKIRVESEELYDGFMEGFTKGESLFDSEFLQEGLDKQDEQ